MKFVNPNAEAFVPDKLDLKEAIKRTTHMSIGAHQDDLEIMATDGILKCYQEADKWFMGVVVTNGAGSAREGAFKDYTDEEMQAIRKIEQRTAASVGKFGAVIQLDYPSKETKNPKNYNIIVELASLIELAKPEILYTHNLADKHDTHLGVVTKTIQAIRTLKNEYRPKKLYGCEVWRNLDWLNDDEKVIFDVSGNPELSLELINIFQSQIAGGKRYDLATIGRRFSNATYSSSHTVDESDAIIYAMDLTPLISDDNLDIKTFINDHINRFKDEVTNKLDSVLE
ncbi:MAG: PIG-L family deacetylase [Candidatus Izimaplasma sp.]|nr:PIG-L family deacetylase [Candidatus Izimaplasma bacterium]